MSRNTLFEPVCKCNAQKMLIFLWDQYLETSILFVSKIGQVTFVKGGWRKMNKVPFSAVSENKEFEFNSFAYPRRFNLSMLGSENSRWKTIFLQIRSYLRAHPSLLSQKHFSGKHLTFFLANM